MAIHGTDGTATTPPDSNIHDSLEQLTLDTVSEHIFELFSAHKPHDNQNLGYISRTEHALHVTVTMSEYDLYNAESRYVAGSSSGVRRINARQRRDANATTTRCVLEFEIHQSPELLNSTSNHNSTTGAVLWQVSPLFAQWVLTPTSVFHHLFARSDTKMLEIGAGVSGILACTLSAPMLARRNAGGVYIATDQFQILPLLRKNVQNNIVTVQDSIMRINHRKREEVGFVSLTLAGKHASREEHSIKGHHHCQSSTDSGPRIEVMELDWEHARMDIQHIRSNIFPSAPSTDFDVVIACDTVYNDFLISPFVDTLALLAGNDTHILVAMQMRAHDVQEEFITTALEKGLAIWHVPAEQLSTDMRDGFAVYYMQKIS
ncbi:uncharacterized protein V1518DRAFT_410847 [Limtongia smithiae]|uniref:uncharacterized protein n=1 Tax=Limtongia smithiae TaxID=1125753 RepID=UPI0034CF4323